MKKLLFFLITLSITELTLAQDTIINGSKYLKPANFTSQQNQQNMMQQLGITKLRPGPSGNEAAPNHANYDTTAADPCPQLPDILTTKDGKKVTTTDTWWKVRRRKLSKIMNGKCTEEFRSMSLK
jgi:hypothetical protein